MRIHRARTAALAVPLALLLPSCSGAADTPVGGGPSELLAAPSFSPHPELEARERLEEQRRLGEPAPDGASPGPGAVRDAFAGLQATLDDSCDTPGNCAYFLGRVLDELDRLDTAMKADRKGPGHFPEPIAWIASMRKELGDDRSFENLKKHQGLLLGTRDRINTWMQDHPDDYR